MRDPLVLVAAALALAAGTYAFRLAGPLLRARIRFPPRAQARGPGGHERADLRA
jgi:hypothetical protein